MQTIDVPPAGELLSLEEAADFLCVSKSTLYRLLDQRKLSGMKAGKQWRFRKEDLLAYMQRGPAAQALAKVPMPLLDDELAFLAGELARAGAAPDAFDDPALEGEAGKISQLVRRMVGLLVTLRGSDIHLNPVWEPEGPSVLLLLRVDGALLETRRLPYALLDALVLEWKRLSGMAIEEHRRPQEGSIHPVAFGHPLVSLRVAIVPTIHGEKVSVRTLPTRIPTLEELGIDLRLWEWCQKQRGVILIVGPTGCGKMTTRAACIQAIHTQYAKNIMTVEDPVEYRFPRGVTQLNVDGFSVAEGVRAVLHHDPDVIVIGEIRDAEVARLAFEAADTGHLVLACMHASESSAPLSEFLEWGLKRALVAKNLIGIDLQCLYPRLCGECKVPIEVEPALLEKIRQAAAAGGCILPADPVFYQRGCPRCGGRIAISEFITFTPAVRMAFLQSATMEEFTSAVRQQGQCSHFAEVVQKALAGLVPLDIVLRELPF